MSDSKPHTFRVITDYPLPLDANEVAAFAENHPQLNPDIYVDALHEDHITLLAENAEWCVITIDLDGFDGRVYVWNGDLGEGLAVQTDEWAAGNLAEAFALYRQAVTEIVSRADLPLTPDEDAECPYCDGEFTASTMPSGAVDRRCTNCGENRSIG